MKHPPQPPVVEDEGRTSTADTEVEVREFEFTADLVVELPTDVEPKKFFDYLMRVLIAHTEAYGGSIGGETKWQPYEAQDDE